MANVKSARDHAYSILAQAFFRERKAAPLITAAAKKLKDRRDRAFVAELVNGTIKMARLLDGGLNTALARPLEQIRKRDNAVKVVLRMGLYQMLFLTRVPSFAVVNESVDLYKKTHDNPRLTKLVNAVLRKLADRIESQGRESFIDSIVEKFGTTDANKLALRYSYNDYFVNQLLTAYGDEKTESILKAGNEIPKTTLRVNLRRRTRDQVANAIAKAGIATDPGGNPASLWIIGPVNVARLPGFTDGAFMVQDESAQKVGPFLDADAGHDILDMCAAPGGKTIQIHELTEGKASITAVDISIARMGELESNLNRMGATGIRALTSEADLFAVQNPAAFDRVLVDVPCSNSGVLRRRPEARLRLVKNKLRSLADKGLNILTAASGTVRLGGKLVYSTCSILPVENENVVRKFLESRAGFELETEQTILPEPGGAEGGYIARIIRKADLA